MFLSLTALRLMRLARLIRLVKCTDSLQNLCLSLSRSGIHLTAFAWLMLQFILVESVWGKRIFNHCAFNLCSVFRYAFIWREIHYCEWIKGAIATGHLRQVSSNLRNDLSVVILLWLCSVAVSMLTIFQVLICHECCNCFPP